MSKPEVETSTQIGCTLEVVGYTRGGGKATHFYSIDAKNPPKSYQDCKRIAGDFESLITAKVVTCRTVSKMTVVTKKIV